MGEMNDLFTMFAKATLNLLVMNSNKDITACPRLDFGSSLFESVATSKKARAFSCGNKSKIA